jgi:polyhydroxyalkanoate synthesis repressor PhaR
MARLIKRYENRKLYDTASSEYVSLSDIAELVRSGETVRVVDNATGRDLTAQTLTQIILEEGKNGKAAIPSDILHQLLRRSEEALDTGFEQLRTTVDGLVQTSLGRLRRLVQGPGAKELEELRSQLQSLERRLSALLEERPDLDASPGSTAEDASPQDASPQDARPEDTRPEEARPEEARPEEARPEDTHSENSPVTDA